jgi:hypothetical protein
MKVSAQILGKEVQTVLRILILICGICVCVEFRGFSSESNANSAQTAAQKFADVFLTHALDRYGPQKTPFFVQMIELDPLKIPAVQSENGWRSRNSGEWAEAMRNWPDDQQYTMWGKWFSNVGIANTANLSTDLEMLQGLLELSEVTGNPQYRQAAEGYLRFFFSHMVSPVTGFWAWGAHMSWDTLTDKVQGDRHELSRGQITPWEMLSKFDSNAVRSEIDSLQYHIKDTATFAFDRHHRYWHKNLPESETNGYNEYAMRYIHAWAYMFSKTHDPKYQDLIHRMLLSRRSKTAGRADIFPYLWNPDLDIPVALGWQNSLTIATYLLDAYRLSPDPWLLDPALRIISQYKGGSLANWGGETFGPDSGSKALPLAYEITRDPAIRQKMLTAAEAFLQAKAQAPVVQMAQSVGQQLFFLVDVYMATGDSKWWKACSEYLPVTTAKFQHTNGFIRGTAGLRRPDFYDASQGPGDLFAAWTRLAFLERKAVLVGWDFPASLAPDATQATIKARLHNPKQCTSVWLEYRLGNAHESSRIRGLIENDQVTFAIPLIPPSKSPIAFWASVNSPAEWHSDIFRIALTSDSVPPQIGDPVALSLMPNDETGSVVFPVTDSTGLEKVTLHYTYGDRINYSDAKNKPRPGNIEFRIQNDRNYEGNIYYSVEAVDSSTAHNTSFSDWHLLQSYSRIRTNVNLGEKQTQAKIADLTLSLTGEGKFPITLKRTSFAPAETPDSSNSFRKYFHIETDHWNKQVREASMWVEFTTNDLVGIVPHTLHFERWNGNWTSVSSKADLANGRVTTTEAAPGWWKLSATSRAKWSSELHGESAGPTLADLNGDGKWRVISAMVGAAPAAVLDAAGKPMMFLDVGERIRQTGNYTGVAVLDIDGDQDTEVLVGSADTHLYCFNSSGKRKWRTKTNGLVRGGTAVGKLLGDNRLQIVIATDVGTIFVLNATGEILWSKQLGSNSGGTPVLAKLDASASSSILYATREPPALWALNSSGSPVWTFALPARPCDPAIGDLDGDGTEEIVVGCNALDASDANQGQLIVLNLAGKQIRQFPVRCQKIERRGISSVALADLDGDATREIIVECEDGGAYCFDYTGKERWCFLTKENLNGFPSFADLDNDGKTDVVIAANDWHVYALNGQGKLLWDHKGVWYNAYSAIADIDSDGLLDVVYNSPRIPGLTCLRTEGRATPGKQPWPTMRGNVRRTGSY